MAARPSVPRASATGERIARVARALMIPRGVSPVADARGTDGGFAAVSDRFEKRALI